MGRALFSFFTRSIALRLAAAFILFLMPVVYLGFNLVAKQNTEIAFSERELAGAQFLRSTVQVHAALIEAKSHTDTTPPSYFNIDALLAGLKAQSAQQNQSLGMAPYVDKMSADISNLGSSGNLYAGKLDTAINASRDLNTAIMERSNLILDPELSSYYLMEVVGLRALPLIDKN
jgi:methyl-accepting chemotaxis protein